MHSLERKGLAQGREAEWPFFNDPTVSQKKKSGKNHVADPILYKVLAKPIFSNDKKLLILLAVDVGAFH